NYMSKRINGAGNIRNRKDNRCEGRYYDKLDGNRQKSIYGHNQQEVVRQMQFVQCKQGNGEYIKHNDILLDVWMDVWIENYSQHLKPLTVSSYRTIIRNHLKPTLGHLTLRELTTEIIQNVYNQKSATLSAKTINNIHGCLHMCLRKAVELHNGYLDYNPADGCSLPKVPEFEIETLENEDVQSLLSAIDINDIYDQISLIALFTGMRQSEILGLRWKDVDLEYAEANICRQLQKDRTVHTEYDGKYFIGLSPKGNRNRVIDLPDFVISILKKRKQQQMEDKKRAKEDNAIWLGSSKLNRDLIFTKPNGDHLVHSTVWARHKKLLKRSNLTPSRFHDLRHSYATISLSIGENLKTVQANMGHRSAAFMLKKYGHQTKGMRKASANRMQEFIQTQSKDYA
ncbi:MAG: site-specific integrase, partial [Clostridia bacterium]|nr:site-specific integrase [Clostridia bacterium]